MNEVPFYQITLFIDRLKTLISYQDTQHYACIDEYSNCSLG